VNPSHVIIDGYNVIHQWPLLQAVLKQNGHEAACEQLARHARILHDQNEAQVTVVFDGQGDKVQILHPGKEDTFSIVFSPSGVAADTLIENMVSRTKRPKTVTVVTRDHMLAEVVGSLGAMVVSPEGFQEWIEATQGQQAYRLNKKQKALDEKWRKEQKGIWDVLND